MTKRSTARKRRKSKASPNTTPNTSPDSQPQVQKKLKQVISKPKPDSAQADISDPSGDTDIENQAIEALSETSEHSEQYLDAEETLEEQLHESHDSLESDKISSQNNSTIYLPVNMDLNMDGSMYADPSQQDQVAAQLTSTPVFQHPQFTQIPAVPQMQYSQPCTSISDNDVIRIAAVVKQMLSSEIETLVKERVQRETADLKSTISTLQADNKKLTDSVSKLEVKLSSRVDDLEQYSRRSCLRIAGIPETQDEDTDVLVLELAARLNINVQSSDIEVSHRVGPQRGRPAADADGFGMVSGW